MMRLVVALGTVITVVSGHGSMTIPKPRNTIDGDVAPWNGSVPWPTPFDSPNWCATPSSEMVGKDPHNLTGSHGQACALILSHSGRSAASQPSHARS